METFDQKLKAEFEEYGFHEFQEGAETRCQAFEVLGFARRLKEEHNFIFLLDICSVDHYGKTDSGGRFEVIYHFLNLEEFYKLRLRVTVPEDCKFVSLNTLWSSASMLEREIHDMHGIHFGAVNERRLLNPDEMLGHPLRKDFKPTPLPRISINPVEFPVDASLDDDQRCVRSWINLGPHHPVLNNNVRVMLELEGEFIRRSQFEIGFYHRGWEKQAESFNYHQIIALSERLNHHGAFQASLAWCRGVEESTGIQIPERAMAIRMVFTELSRIQDHLECLGNCAVAGGNEAVYFLCQQGREILYEIFEKMSGYRLCPAINRMGGVKFDLPIGWITDCFGALKQIESQLQNIDLPFTKSAIWLDRNKVCDIQPHEALEYGITGPVLRGSGVNYDLRKVKPFYFYDEVEFEIPLGVNGQSYDRYLVRMEEIRQSISIIIQVLDNLPTGAIMHEDYKRPFTKLNIPIGGFYTSLESSNGELGFYIESDGSERPWRVKVRSPSFHNLQIFPIMIKDRLLDDALVAFSSLNICPGELDR